MKHKGNSKQFNLAKQMKETGIKTGLIAKTIEKSYGTVANWLKYESWDEYCKIQTKRTRDCRLRMNNEPSKTEAFRSEVLWKLHRIEEMLSQKKVIW